MAPHYAISEALIVLAALWCGWKLFAQNQWMGAVGALLFGAAAAVGVYRFPSGQIEELANFHRLAGQLGGLIGMAFLTTELMKLALPENTRTKIIPLALALILLCLITAWLRPAIAVPLFLSWSLLGIAVAFFIPHGSFYKRFLYGIAAGGMLLNVLFIRKSDLMAADTSWHIFHTLIAIWLILMWYILRSKNVQKTRRTS